MANRNFCGVCCKRIKVKPNTKFCNCCFLPIHIKCSKRTKNSILNDKNYFCLKCIKNSIPFYELNNEEFLFTVTKGSRCNYQPSFNILPTQSQQNLLNEINNISQGEKRDVINNKYDGESLINCKYYNINDFTQKTFNSSNNFSMLHLNATSEPLLI